MRDSHVGPAVKTSASAKSAGSIPGLGANIPAAKTPKYKTEAAL